MESESYRLETTFLADGRSVLHTTPHAGHPSTTTLWTTTDGISRGGNGVVDLQYGPSSLFRAVKSVREPATYMKEVTALSKVSDNGCRLITSDIALYKDKNFLYIAMEYVVDGDLGRYIKARGDSLLPEGIWRPITGQLLEGLQVLHQRLICHRDLKPQNILVASLDPIQVKITDFGVSEGYRVPHKRCIIHELPSLQRPFLRESEDPDTILTDESSILDSSQVPPETDMAYLMAYYQGHLPLCLGELERSGVSMDSKALVRALLRADPATRVKVTEALEHPGTKALYPFGGHWYPTYTNQLSFSMHETLDIVDVSLCPAWWNARNQVGQRGWIPSSYFVVIDSRPSIRRVSDRGAVCKGSACAGCRTGSCNSKFEASLVSDKPYRLLSKLRDNAGSHSSPALPCAECNQKFKHSRLLKTHILGAHWQKVNQIQRGAGDAAGNGEISDVTSADLDLTPQMYALNMDPLQNQSHQLPAAHVKNIFPDPAVYVNSDSTDVGPRPLVSWAFKLSYHASSTIAGTECGLIHDYDEAMGDQD
ncbi:kinase-like domain-containing protein [Morchella snyderi]|nr:kinase-like domain-containing protein [Morchella snyderi]